MSGRRELQPLERRLARALLFVSACLSLTCIALFFGSGHWVRTDGQVVLALLVFLGGLLAAGFALVALLMLLLGVVKR